MRLIKLTQILCCIGFVCLTATAQTQSNIAEAVKFYDKGDYQAAAAALQEITKSDSKNGEAFYYLGAAQLSLNDLKTAAKSFKKAVKLSTQDARPVKGLAFSLLLQNQIADAKKQAANAVALAPKDAEAHYLVGVTNLKEGGDKTALTEADQAIALNKNFAAAYSLKADALTFVSTKNDWYESATPAERTQRFRDAVQVIESFPNLNGNSPGVVELRDKLEAYQAFVEPFVRSEEYEKTKIPFSQLPPDPSVKPLQILRKPPAEYTDSARSSRISGTVLLLVLFSKNGKISNIVVLKNLGGGLTEQAVRAARQMTFKPQEKNGQPVSVAKRVEYNFNI